ncbi:MAG: amidohydrolase family protein, partial [Actinomycetota bacterium]|nr:amidohydrolase family protein [Actinomycetota bacterium]
MQKERIDLIISGGTILCLDARMQVLTDSCIAISAGRITDILPQAQQKYAAQEVLDASGCIIIPGLINAHTHIPMTYFRGLADDLPLMKWLQEYIWPLESKLVKTQFVFDASLHGAAEMLKNGIVLANDMYFHGEEIARALSQAGMRGIIGEAVIQTLLPKDGSIGIGQKTLELKEAFSGNPLVDFAITPHSIYTCDRNTLEKCTEVALANDLLVHIHLSETKAERESCIESHGKKPVEYLAEIGMLKARTILAHGIWIDEQEMKILSQNRISVATCLESNLKLVSGILPMQKYHKARVNICLGTDGVASNNNLDLFAEMDMNAKLH